MLLLVALNCASVAAQAYPTEPIRVIVSASPGDRCDALSRLVGLEIHTDPPEFSTETMRKDLVRRRAREVRFAPR